MGYYKKGRFVGSEKTIFDKYKEYVERPYLELGFLSDNGADEFYCFEAGYNLAKAEEKEKIERMKNFIEWISKSEKLATSKEFIFACGLANEILKEIE
jgi:hypothetical protein